MDGSGGGPRVPVGSLEVGSILAAGNIWRRCRGRVWLSHELRGRWREVRREVARCFKSRWSPSMHHSRSASLPRRSTMSTAIFHGEHRCLRRQSSTNTAVTFTLVPEGA